MQKPDIISLILSILTAVGGFSFIHILMNRRWEKQKLSTENRSYLEETQRKQVDWLERRINERDRRIDSIFHELRQEQKNTVEILTRLHSLQLQLNEARLLRCENTGCLKRKNTGRTEKNKENNEKNS